MGGKNHQPCNMFLEKSTRLSRTLSKARLNLEHANIALEDVILAELNGRTLRQEFIELYLQHSLAAIIESGQCAQSLRQQMNDEHFEDLPTLHTIDFDQLGVIFVSKGMVDERAFNQLVSHLREGGFYGVVAEIIDRIEGLHQRTSELTNAAAKLRTSTYASQVNVILEENLPGNIREEFAKPFVEWSVFDQFFMASAMVSTEQWYVFMNYPSLTSGEPVLFVPQVQG